MRWSLLLAGAIGLAASCRDTGPTRPECERLCSFALDCGFLPSSLGGQIGDDRTRLYEGCRRRCDNTSDETIVAAIQGCMGDDEGDACDPSQCLAAADCIHLSKDVPDEVLGTSDVMIRALDGVYWATIFDPEICETSSSNVNNNYGLDNYCAELDGRASLLENYDCGDRATQPPLCLDQNCEEPLGCDPSMCNRSFVIADADCRYYGIESVQLGYRETSGALVLSPTLLTCAEASRGELFTNVPYGSILPVALFRGKFSPATAVDLGLDPEEAAGREFCWASWPPEPRRLTRSGQTTLVVPTPSSAQLYDAIFERNREFPVGCGCAFETIDCEELATDCQNGIDDDEDGLIDDEDFGCLHPSEQQCSNGIDDDMDGSVDELDHCEPCNGVDDDDDGRPDGNEPECVRCGDGIIGPAESCDDGNLVDGDGCSAECQPEGAETASTSG